MRISAQRRIYFLANHRNQLQEWSTGQLDFDLHGSSYPAFGEMELRIGVNTNCVVVENVYQSDTYVSFIAFGPDSVYALTPSHIGLLMWGTFLLRCEKQTG